MRHSRLPGEEKQGPEITIRHANAWVAGRHDLAFLVPLFDGLLRRNQTGPAGPLEPDRREEGKAPDDRAASRGSDSLTY